MVRTSKSITAWTIAAAAAGIAAVSFATLPPQASIISCALGWTMLAIAVSDARRLIVPDVLSLPAIPAGLLVAMLTEYGAYPPLIYLAAAALGAAALYAIRGLYSRLRGRQGLGLGDVKLAAVAGAWTGLEGLSLVLLLATAAAMGWVLLSHAVARRPLDGALAIPFGAFLAPAIWATWWLITSGLVGSEFGGALSAG